METLVAVEPVWSRWCVNRPFSAAHTPLPSRESGLSLWLTSAVCHTRNSPPRTPAPDSVQYRCPPLGCPSRAVQSIPSHPIHLQSCTHHPSPCPVLAPLAFSTAYPPSFPLPSPSPSCLFLSIPRSPLRELSFARQSFPPLSLFPASISISLLLTTVAP